MKTAISIPDDIFQAAEQMAQRKKISRSELFTDAVQEYMRNHGEEDVTERINEAMEKIGSNVDPAWQEHANRMLRKVEW